MPFLDDRYLLGGDTAVGLFAGVRDLPIIDPHNHADVRQIAENRPFADLWEAEAATDHYVWEMLRKRGVPERAITGDAAAEEKWLALANVFEELAGNPTFEWVHLDLRRRFGIEELVCPANAVRIWERTRALLQQPEGQPQALLQAMKVERMCSTDDPLDSLEHHAALEHSPLAGVVRPTFRPDKVVNIFRKDWPDTVARLEEQAGGKFKSVRDLVAALQARHDVFAARGCVASDHGVQVPYGYAAPEADADAAYRKARAGRSLAPHEITGFMSYLLHAVGEMDAAKDWVFQLHIGPVRDVRDRLARTLGPDSGGDISDHQVDIVAPLRDFLNRFDGRLKIVLYALEPGHQATLATLARAFGERVSLGAAWWMNDSPIGMRRQLEYIGSVDLLWNFAGMVSDSRKLLSYGSRHEMFRRVLCDVLGGLVDRGQVPIRLAERLAGYLCHRRPKELFGL
jgi:glucuronate isomerase